MKGLLGFLTVCSLFVFGCSSGDDPQVRSAREKFLLSDAPTGALDVMQAREQVTEQDKVVLRGRVGAGEHDPFREGKASFLICDDSLFDHDDATEGHDPDSCPFCKRRQSALESLALIQFTDESGDVVPIDSRKLFGLEKNQLVTVRGTGQVDPSGNFVVKASELHVAKE